MGGYGFNQPNFTQILELWWGGAYECSGWAAYAASAANVIVGTNPPWTLSDFLATNAKFFGPPTAVTGAFTIGLATATLTPPQGTTLTPGMFLAAAELPGGTTILSLVGTTATLSTAATASATDTAVNVYTVPWLPILVIQLYINLASSCLQQLRWGQMWYLAMGFYVAHFATLFIQSDQGANLTAAEVATSGLQQGVITSQSAGDVSASTQPVTGLDDWAGWNLTQYGVQLATFAKIIGSGIMYLQ
jgi:Protein of unknown function (DUF4054)